MLQMTSTVMMISTMKTNRFLALTAPPRRRLSGFACVGRAATRARLREADGFADVGIIAFCRPRPRARRDR
jgi:hypothetical protein